MTGNGYPALPGFAARELQSRILDEVDAAIVALDPRGAVVLWSRGAERLFGWTAEEMVGREAASLAVVPGGEGSRALRGLVAELGLVEGEYELRRKDGSHFTAYARTTALRDEGGELAGYVSVSLDVTARREAEQLAGSIVDSLQEGIIAIDAEGSLLMVNAAAQRILGVTEPELRADPAWWRRFDVRFANGEQPAEGQSPGAHALATGRPVRGVAMYAIRADGAPITLLANYQPLLEGGSGRPYGLVVSFSDQTERRQAEERFERSFLDAPIGMAVVGLDGRFVQVNPALCEMLARSEDELEARHWQEPTHPDDVAAGEDWGQRVLTDPGVSALRLDKRCVRGDGGVVDVAVAVSLIRDGAGRPQFFICQYQDIGERKRYEAELAHRALHDTLTGLANRALLEEQLGQALARARRNGGLVAVLFLDLDGFKRINDSLGHRAGDALLREVAERLRGAVRPSDVVARFGGDEFVVLSEIARREEALTIAQRVERALSERPLTAWGEDVLLTASVGVCLTRGLSGDEPERLVQSADAAMYRAKRLGGARIELPVDGVDRPPGARPGA